MSIGGSWYVEGPFGEDVRLVNRFEAELPRNAEAIDPEYGAWCVGAWFPSTSDEAAQRSLDVLQRIGRDMFAVPTESEPDLEALRERVREALANGRLVAFRVKTVLGSAGEPMADEVPGQRVEATVEKTWIEIVLRTDEAPPRPVAFKRYRIELPDGSVAEGMLDEKGMARVVGIDPGTCQVTFPALDAGDWR
jgi:hypothetical protein